MMKKFLILRISYLSGAILSMSFRSFRNLDVLLASEFKTDKKELERRNKTATGEVRVMVINLSDERLEVS